MTSNAPDRHFAMRAGVVVCACIMHLAVAAVSLRAQDAGMPASVVPSGQPQGTETQVRQLMHRMQDRDYAVREAAQRELWELGEAAIPALREALKTAPLESEMRGRTVLELLELGLSPAAPPAVVAEFRMFGSATPEQQQMTIRELSRDPQWVPALIALIDRAAEPGVREQLLQLAQRHSVVLSRRWIAEGQFNRAEQMLRSAIVSGNSDAIEMYFRILDDSGRASEALQLADRCDPKTAATLRFWAHRLLHNTQGAADAARDLAQRGETEPQKILWFESRDAKSLAGHYTDLARQENASFNDAAQAAYFTYLTKDPTQADAALERLVEVSKREDNYGSMVAEVFFLTRRRDRAISILVETAPAAAFPYMWDTHRVGEALALLDRPQTESRSEIQLLLTTALQLTRNDCIDRANPLIEKAKMRLLPVEPLRNAWGWNQYARTMMAAGRRQQLLAEAAKLPPGQRFPLVSAVLPERRAAACEPFWNYLEQSFPDAPLAENVARLERLAARKLSGADLDQMLPELKKWAVAVPEPKRREAETAVISLLDDLARHGEAREMMMQILQREPTRDTYVRAMERAIATESWRDAAWAAGMVAAEFARQQGGDATGWAETVYTQGFLMARNGDAEAGKALMKRGRLMMSSESWESAAFIRRLRQLKADEELAREIDWVDIASSIEFSDRMTNLRIKSMSIAPTDGLRAAEMLEWSLAPVCRTESAFMEYPAYLMLPAQICDTRANGYIRNGDFPAAIKEIGAAAALLPGDADWFSQRYSVLKDAGFQQQADAIFDTMWKSISEACKALPESTRLANSRAWLGATCGRNLDESLRSATQAVEKRPENPGYLDTLALVHFRRGSVQQAIDIQRRAVSLMPNDAAMRKRLEEFEKSGK